VGNLSLFAPGAAGRGAPTLEPFDRWALAELERTAEEVLRSYEEYEYHVAYQRLVNYCTVELSGIYLDGIKVRLYTQPAGSHARRSAQTVLGFILDSLIRLLAPILSFTAEEAWGASGSSSEESVHLAEFAPPRPEHRDAELEREWDVLLRARQAVTAELEKLRGRKEIGSSLDGQVEIAVANDGEREILERRAADLEEVFIVSRVTLREAAEGEGDFAVSATPAEGRKCQRCWRYRTDVGADVSHPDLCEECAGIVE
jgi:isoleucyl-tRNA synthetase